MPDPYLEENLRKIQIGQGGPGMLKIAQGWQIFLWRQGVPPSPPPFPKWICQTKKENSKKKMKISLQSYKNVGF